MEPTWLSSRHLTLSMTKKQNSSSPKCVYSLIFCTSANGSSIFSLLKISFEVILESSLFEYPTSNLSVNTVSSAFKIDPEPYHFLPSFGYHPSPNTHAFSLDYYFSFSQVSKFLLLSLPLYNLIPYPIVRNFLLKYQVRSFYRPKILQWLLSLSESLPWPARPYMI